jgi:hypothetical protein
MGGKQRYRATQPTGDKMPERISRGEKMPKLKVLGLVFNNFFTHCRAEAMQG